MITVFDDNNCPIIDQTNDGLSIGQCWYYLQPDGVCPLHGDVGPELAHYRATGMCTFGCTMRLRKTKGEKHESI